MSGDQVQHKIAGQPVIRQVPGQGTGETLYQTVDGYWWSNVPPLHRDGTGEVQSHLTATKQ